MKAFVVFASLVCLVRGGSWSHVRIGKPFVDLQDLSVVVHADFLRGVFSLPGEGYAAPSHMVHVEHAMCAAVAENGLDLDTNTVANGDCGLDAVLRNLERLQLNNPQAVRLLNALREGGRDAALNAMRLMLLIWIRDHSASEILPGIQNQESHRHCFPSPWHILLGMSQGTKTKQQF